MSAATGKTAPSQFGTRAIAWLMATLGAALAYLRLFGVEATLAAFAVIAAAALLGAIVGTLFRRTSNAAYWAILGAAFAYISALGIVLDHWTIVFGWSLAGAASGAALGVMPPGRPVRRALLGGTVAMAALAANAAVVQLLASRLILFDVLAAAVAGIAFAGVVETIETVELRGAGTPRYVWAALLMLFIVIGNCLSGAVLR